MAKQLLTANDIIAKLKNKIPQDLIKTSQLLGWFIISVKKNAIETSLIRSNYCVCCKCLSVIGCRDVYLTCLCCMSTSSLEMKCHGLMVTNYKI